MCLKSFRYTTEWFFLELTGKHGKWEVFELAHGQVAKSGNSKLAVLYIAPLPGDTRVIQDFLNNSALALVEGSSNQRLSIADNLARALVGQFTVVFVLEREIIILSDITRTFPIFYTRCRKPNLKNESVDGAGRKRESTFTWLISDSADTLVAFAEPRISRSALTHFKRSGYTPTDATIIEDIRQVEAGTVTFLTSDGRVWSNPHFSYAAMGSEYMDVAGHEQDFTELLERAEETIVKSLSDYVPILQRSLVVIPLSGGYDSRLVACTLKMLGLSNVLCFTYGVRSSREVEISEAVAKSLGFRWIFVPYDVALFQETIKSGAFFEYLKFAHNFSSLPHIQDFFAVHFLKKNGLVSTDTIFVPGHTGDFYSGAHILPGVHNSKNLKPRDVAELIYLYHYYLDVHSRKHEIVEQLECDIQSREGEVFSIVEDWDRRNRQAKYIINSLRVYEFFGFRHAIPLWHRSIAEFFRLVPPKFKDVYSPAGLERNLYVNTARSVFRRYNVDFERDFSKRFMRLQSYHARSRGWGKVIKRFRDFLKENVPGAVQSLLLYLERRVKRPFEDKDHNFSELAELLDARFYYVRSGILGVLAQITTRLMLEELRRREE